MYKDLLKSVSQQIKSIEPVKRCGKVRSVKGITIECLGIAPFVCIGSLCYIDRLNDSPVLSEIVGFVDDLALAMPYGHTDGIGVNSKVEVLTSNHSATPDMSWRGRVLDAFARPIDAKGPIKEGEKLYPIKGSLINAQDRRPLGGKMELGIRSIDAFASCCYGQRMGIFAGSGVGKSVLISMITKYAKADVKVIGLIGERGREVNEFINEYLGGEGLKNAVVVVSTGDEPALMRKRAAYLTLTISEYFRDQGLEVLCIFDSVTRFAMSLREIGLAVGEPPTSKGYTPSVFSELPKLLERAGPGTDAADITALFTVLVEGDDQNEPISDAVRGILDGHIVLDRNIAQRGVYPPVDVLKSVSRSVPRCNTSFENNLITYAKKMLSLYNEMSDMIRIGAYKRGTDNEVDNSIKYFNQLEQFFTQAPDEYTPMEESYAKLASILGKK